MAAITVSLSREEHDRLRLIAEREKRHLSQQAAFLLVDAIDRRLSGDAQMNDLIRARAGRPPAEPGQ